jgi:hypothetical protein
MRKRRLGMGLTVAALAVAGVTAGTGPASAQDGVHNIWTVVDADGGVYWRSQPQQDTAIQNPGHGVYTGDQVYLACYRWGGPGPTNNHLWYLARNLSRNQQPDGNYEEGYVNDHYLSTPGTARSPEPQGFPCG